MTIEIEKKYRLSKVERDRVEERLREVDAKFCGEEFEENTLYTGGIIDIKNCVLRLRRVDGKAILTFKERFPSSSAIKKQREEESAVDDANAIARILDALGYRASVIYEKRRATWQVANTEVVIDALPFGLFMEVEGDEQAIMNAEKLLGLGDLKAEMATYPQLAAKHGKKAGEKIEARF